MQSILTFNCGSSSIKFSLINIQKKEMLLSGIADKMSTDKCTLTFSYQTKVDQYHYPQLDYQLAIQKIIHHIDTLGLSDSIIGIGHRVVHGGSYFSDATLINDDAIEKIKRITPLAPLHNFANLEGIETARQHLPHIPQSASFDTAFHQSIPPSVHRYAIPSKLYQQKHVRKYGFHGISHAYVSQKLSSKLDLKYGNYISAHLGNGCSVTAIKDGKSIDTSMGLTPLDGLVMGTRSGSIDPGVFAYLQSECGLELSDINSLLNRQSGLLGLCGFSDMRDIEKEIAAQNKNALEAFEIFCHRLAKYIASYMLYFTKLDGLIFTGGIGENSILVREKVTRTLNNLGFYIDSDLNTSSKQQICRISHQKSTHPIWIVPTDEELYIAQDCYRLIHPIIN
ncbi:acetate/propionate family kinase [Fangia hongkongensis]|uniref:acetate/propionate family kinase n=1 Tax=Fangia hongkongensis TaxID=270495 RepID=UPI000377D1CC|nr:acetate kinase [Fangia hongkongensis]MBK2125198.1 acetate kinase [Fangia hongkongensis]